MFRGERIADVWFKPEGEPSALLFRIPQSSFQNHEIAQRLTPENLLRAVAVATAEVESWQQGDTSHSVADGADPGLTTIIPPPPNDVAHLEILVRLKPTSPAAGPEVKREAAAVSSEWHELEALWKSILGLEASVDTVRKTMEGLRAELDALMRRALAGDDKVYALAADVLQWNKAKSRAHYALPKASEFIHRATWALGTPERKRLGEIFKNPLEVQTSLPPAGEMLQELEMLRKDRHVLSAKGMAVFQECKAIAVDIQTALRRLQSNALNRASQKKGGAGAKGKSF
jgi:hypothetical protein